jgi:ATP-dependent Clp protease ATP-binding subunit ClpC
MWQRFNSAAQRCIVYAQWEAERCGTRFVCSEHLLLGICKEAITPPAVKRQSSSVTSAISGNRPPSLAQRLRRRLVLPPALPPTDLALLGLNWSLVREETERRTTRGMGMGGEMQLSRRAKRIIDLAYDEARGLMQPTILPQHLLIGVLREREGAGALALTRLGVTLETLRQWVQEPQSGILLRSAALPDEAPEELLRPVERDQDDPDPQTLLRPQQKNGR